MSVDKEYVVVVKIQESKAQQWTGKRKTTVQVANTYVTECSHCLRNRFTMIHAGRIRLLNQAALGPWPQQIKLR